MVDKVDVVKLLSGLVSIFPNYYKENNVDADSTANMWTAMLKDYDKELINSVAKDLIKKNYYFPSLSEILCSADLKILAYKKRLQSYYNTHFELPLSCQNCESYKENVEIIAKCGAVLCPRTEDFKKYQARNDLTERQINAMKRIINYKENRLLEIPKECL